MPKQLTFKFTKNENTFENFYPGSNQIIWNVLQNFTQQNEIFCVFLWGETGLGKTHLLKACIDKTKETSLKAAYFSAKDLDINFAKTEFDDFSLVAIDDIEQICQHPFLEEAVFHLYNQLITNNRYLLLAGNTAPKNLPLTLPDLRSRLNASYSTTLQSLTDDEKLLILESRSNARGFTLSKEVMTFIITHFPRDMGKLINILDRLDEATLAEKRLVTVPFIKKIL